MLIGRNPPRLADLRRIAQEDLPLELDPACLPALRAGYEEAIACARGRGLDLPMFRG